MKRFGFLLITTVGLVGLLLMPAATKTYKDFKNEKTAAGTLTAEPGPAWLGVYLQDIDAETSETFDLPVKRGAVVTDVVDGSPAEEAGLHKDDIIIVCDGKPVHGADDVVQQIKKHQPGDKVDVTVIRDDDQRDMVVTLGRRSGDGKLSRAPQVRQKEYAFTWSGDERGYIGVHLMGLNRQLGEYFGIKKGRGALITEVVEDSPAKEAGLKAGDVIVEVDSDEVADPEDVSEAIGDKEKGDKVTIAVVRDRRRLEIPVEVSERLEKDEALSFYFAPDRDNLAPKLHRPPDVPGVQYYDSDNFKREMKTFKKQMQAFKTQMRQFQKEMEQLKEKPD